MDCDADTYLPMSVVAIQIAIEINKCIVDIFQSINSRNIVFVYFIEPGLNGSSKPLSAASDACTCSSDEALLAIDVFLALAIVVISSSVRWLNWPWFANVIMQLRPHCNANCHPPTRSTRNMDLWGETSVITLLKRRRNIYKRWMMKLIYITLADLRPFNWGFRICC